MVKDLCKPMLFAYIYKYSQVSTRGNAQLPADSQRVVGNVNQPTVMCILGRRFVENDYFSTEILKIMVSHIIL